MMTQKLNFGHSSLIVILTCMSACKKAPSRGPTSADVEFFGRRVDCSDLDKSVSRLKQGDVLPNGLLACDSVALALKLMQRRQELPKHSATMPGQSNSPSHDYTIVIRRSLDAIAKIARSERILNSYQSGTSGGAPDMAGMKARIEDELLGFKVTDRYDNSHTAPAHELRPKYACDIWMRSPYHE